MIIFLIIQTYVLKIKRNDFMYIVRGTGEVSRA